MRTATRSDDAPARSRHRCRDLALCGTALLLTAALAGLVPGSALDSFLPWLAVPAAALAVLSALLRSRRGTATALVPLLVWAGLFAPQMLAADRGGPAALVVASHNLGGRADAASVARSGADLVALQEITAANSAPVSARLDPTHPYRARVGTVGLWSRYPLREVSRIDLGQGWARALHAVAATPEGPVSVYAVHLASVRIGHTALRDRTLRALTQHVRADPTARLLVLGDLNTASTDPLLAPLTETLSDARAGFQFTWPAGFPLTRPDHILTRGFAAVRTAVLPAGGSDHRAVLAGLAGHPGA
ncbi:hypothetical protein CU254_18795 [Amycolatopsis sp. AA4]|uniref:endonuclease/exonuclease/phosphatase family protein n=1 Tax=Actinomycetes TaxID=1760 RepID=UPI0001B5704F|nr:MULTISPECIES: endonuclease/exonuclease/phosphatase family protein [Actinomycetes]ATY12286.1 hypothetical protein CU254_18795 [Amycolatopsis sp. AA4]EFL08026.1 predicted protein [Streptomyces sp. AA4]